MTRSLLRIAVLVGAITTAGCGAVNSTNPPQPAVQSSQARPDNHAPVLAGVTPAGVLKYYPITRHGSGRPQRIATIPHLHGASAIAADGNQLAIANQDPPGVVLYNVKTQAETILSDPYGTPVDIAIDKGANLYVLNFKDSYDGNVTMYAAGTSRPVELDCSYVGNGEAIAADDEGNIFVNDYEQGFTGVVEIPAATSGPNAKTCKRLALKPENGYVAGIAVDPKTDDLIVLDDPDECAGGVEGRMTIYPKPYRKQTGRSVDLNGNCVGPMRLNGDSTIVFAFDETVSGGRGYVIARSYPDGKNMGTYRNGDLSGITTIPNVLPN